MKYFNLAATCGIFPYHIKEEGTVVDYHRSGPVKLWSTLNCTCLILYLFFQLFMITVSSVLGKVNKVEWFAQSCWLIMAIFPLPSISLYSKKKQKMCDVLTQWIQLEKDLIGGKDTGDNGKDSKVSTIFDSKLEKEGMEYDSFRRGLFCYWAQMKTFRKLIKMYIVISLVTAAVVSCHNIAVPQFPAYITSLYEKCPQPIMFASAAFQFYMVALCIIHVGSFEILMMATVRSVRHMIESLSNLNSVSMERRAICGRQKPKNDTLDVATIAENIEKRDATQFGSQQEMQVEDATDNYRRVEFVVENLNNCFSGNFLAHQTLYLAMMCILIFVFLRSSDSNSIFTSLLFTTYSVFFTLRICCVLPFMGKLGEDSEIFIYSWLEEIPKLLRGGKPYETAEVKLHACRVLGINCGDYYDIQGSTILTFFSIVTTYLIILLQL
jgi:hypothetical protein